MQQPASHTQAYGNSQWLPKDLHAELVKKRAVGKALWTKLFEAVMIDDDKGLVVNPDATDPIAVQWCKLKCLVARAHVMHKPQCRDQ